MLPAELARRFTTTSPLDIADADPHFESAAALVWKHGLRGADAVHLATALAAREELAEVEEFYFVAGDVALNRAAAAEGLDVIDPAA